MAGLKKNFLYQTSYQILTTALPLITSPYLSRVLHSEDLGIYSYSSSIVNYFVLFSMIGLNNYGTRSIALTKKNNEELNKTFSQIYSMQLILTTISLIIYYLYLIFFVNENINIFLIQSILIINCFLDIGWFYFGMEEFKITVIRNITVKIITLLCIFIFVKKPEDLWKYVFIMSMGTLLSQIVLIKNLKKFIKLRKVALKDSFKHFKPCLLLFIPILSMSVYHQMDKTMLGILSNYTETGYYYNADKIINMPIGIITGLGMVSLPRISAIISEGKMEEYQNILFKSFSLVMFMCSSITFGIVSISSEFTPWFFGVEYTECSILISVLSIVIYFKAWATIIRNQYLIPFKRDKVYIISVVVGAIINFVINIILIRDLGAMGAVIGTVVAEGVVSILQLYSIRNIVSLKKIFLENLIYIIAGIFMLFIVRSFSIFNINNTTLKVILEIIIGAVTFMSICICYWKFTCDKVFYPIINSMLKKIRFIKE